MPAWSKPLERALGAGGFAVVWQVANEASVLKVARASHDLARAQIAREAEALGAIGVGAFLHVSRGCLRVLGWGGDGGASHHHAAAERVGSCW